MSPDQQPLPVLVEGIDRIVDVRWRDRVKVAGRIRAIRVHPWANTVPSLEITVTDGTARLVAVFLGRRHIGGIHIGQLVSLEGTIIASRGQLILLNPAYELLAR